MSLKIALGACLLAEASANFVSPGLGKCLDLQAELTEDGDRETLAEMEQDPKTNVQLYKCHGDHNQRYEFIYGQFRSWSMKQVLTGRRFCLTAAAIEDNADVHLELCEEGNARQQWDLTGEGMVKVAGSNKCLDVMAALKEDGTREKWDEIKEHKVVNVHLYKCHNPETTDRVNQYWGWAPWKHGTLLNAEIHQDGTACPRPAEWCHGSDQYTEVDCDGDGVADPHCSGSYGSGYLGSSSDCKDNWPQGTCPGEGVASKYSMEYAPLGAARGVVFPGLCAVSFAIAAVAGAVLGLKRLRQATSPSSQLIPADE